MFEQVELFGEEISRCGDHARTRISRVELHRLGRLCYDVLRRRWRRVDTENPAYETQPGELSARLRVGWIERDGLLQRSSCGAERFARPIPLCGFPRPQHEVIGPDLLGALPRSRLGLLESLQHRQNLVELHKRLRAMHPADVAFVLEALPPEDRQTVWDQINADEAGLVFV